MHFAAYSSSCQQLYALTSTGMANNSNVYGWDWESAAPAKNYTLLGMSGAVAALVASIGPTPPPTVPTPTPTPYIPPHRASTDEILHHGIY
jgi:hypothetical protein